MLIKLFNRRFWIVAVVVAGFIVIPSLSFADPPPPPPNELPDGIFRPARVFCFRVTDVAPLFDDNSFQVEFEILNWSNQDAYGMSIMATEVTNPDDVQGETPYLAGASVEPTGRPLGSTGDGANRPDNTPVLNNWEVSKASSSTIRWRSDVPLEGIDLLTGYEGQPWPIQPDDPRVDFLDYDPDDPTEIKVAETIDDGPNALDGFVFTIYDFDPGEVISLNWFLENGFGGAIGTANTGNAYGFGTVNLGRTDGGLVLEPAFVGNTGFDQSDRTFFNEVNFEDPANPDTGYAFAIEFGAGITAPFMNPDDNIFNAPITTFPVSGIDSILYLPVLLKNYPSLPPTPTPTATGTPTSTPTLTPTPTPTEDGSEDLLTPTPIP